MIRGITALVDQSSGVRSDNPSRSIHPTKELAIPTAPPPKRHPYNQWAPDARALDLVGDKWTLLIVRDLVGGPRRFVELQRTLPGISTEQLRSRLNRMVADGLLTRQRYREVPPRVDYELTERARDLLPVIGALARWGYQWAWSAPRGDEQVDIGAILRSVPGLAVPAGFDGTAELFVDAKSYVVGSEDGCVTFVERTAPEADCRISGSAAAWIAALGPDADRKGLNIEGSARQAKALLDALAPVAARMAAVA
jgi:DNA-binding HxlR family transcriptional regulator